MTKQPESSGSSLPRDSSVLGSQLGSQLGPELGSNLPSVVGAHKRKRDPNKPSDQSTQPVKPLASPSPKVRQRSSASRPTASAKKEVSGKEVRRQKKQTNKQLEKPERSRLSALAPRTLRRSSDLEQDGFRSSRLSFLKSQTIDEQRLVDWAENRGSDDELEELEVFGKRLIPVPSFLVSLAVHLAIFLALALVVSKVELAKPAISIIAEFDSTPTPVKPNQEPETETVEIVEPLDTSSPLEMDAEALSTDTEMKVAAQTNVVPSVVENDSEPSPVESTVIKAVKATLPTGGGLEGREEASRARLAASRGGSRASETAVENGIRWIVNHQRDDCSWRLRHIDGKCNGACRNEGQQESATAATGLALMSLLGAGYTQRNGRYQEEVQRGLDYLVDKMRVGSFGGSLAQGNKGMYSHAIATIALSEAYTMTRDTELVEPIELARQYIETAQHKKGGWRYVPGTLGDMTVSGWQVMALKSCERAGFPTGELTWERARSFVDSLSTSGGRFGYQSPKSQSPSTTAVGLLSKMYLGAALEDDQIELGSQYLIGEAPSKTDMYFNFYSTLVLHHRNDQDWPKWNVELRDYLINTQENGASHSAGSLSLIHI